MSTANSSLMNIYKDEYKKEIERYKDAFGLNSYPKGGSIYTADTTSITLPYTTNPRPVMNDVNYPNRYIEYSLTVVDLRPKDAKEHNRVVLEKHGFVEIGSTQVLKDFILMKFGSEISAACEAVGADIEEVTVDVRSVRSWNIQDVQKCAK